MTDPSLTEQQLQSALQRERVSALVLDSMSEGVVVADAHGKFVIWNPAATAIIGMGADSVPPEQWPDHYHIVRPEDESPFPHEELPLVRALEGLSTDERELLILNPQKGKKVNVLCSARPLRAENGEIVGGVVYFHDVTESRRVESELKTYARSISHDLNAPLTGILGFVDALKQDNFDQLDANGQEYLGFIESCANRMTLLIKDLLRHASLDGNVEFSDVDMAEVLENTIENLRSDLEAANAEIHVDTDLPTIWGHRAGLLQLVQNLISNAIKFHRLNSKPVVHIGYVDNGSHRFYVRDNGIGIPAKYQAAIFDVFRRLHGPDDYAGTGIGLAIVKKVMGLHRGNVSVESTEGEGSCFWIQIPKTSGEGEPGS